MSRQHRLMILSKSSFQHLKRAWVLLCIGGLLTRFVMLRRMCSLPSLVHWFDAKPAAETEDLQQIGWVVQFTDALLRRVYGSDYCIPRSLVIFRFMKRGGYPVRLHIGMARIEGKVCGHAWVDLQGQPFAERTDPHAVFKSLYTYPSPSSFI